MKAAVTLLFAAAAICQGSEPAAARWEGAVQIPGRDLRLVIDLALDSHGQWTGSAIVPGFGIKGAPLADIAVNDSAVSFAIKGALGEPKLKGRLTADGAFAGDYQQAGNSAPFLLRNVGPPQVEPPRESTAVPRELEGEWQGEMSYVGNLIHIRLKLTNQPGGKAAGQFVFVGKRETRLPIDLVTEDAGLLTVELFGPGITYEGRFRRDASEITGAFRQGAIEIPLNLRPAPKGATP
jgi:hypothetical protein